MLLWTLSDPDNDHMPQENIERLWSRIQMICTSSTVIVVNGGKK